MTPDSTFDLLAVGVTLTMTLRSDGTTTGTLLVPDVTEDLASTWDATPSVVHFRQPEPQFFNQMPFVIGPGELRGEQVVQPGTIRVTLTKRAGAPGAAAAHTTRGCRLTTA